MANELSANVSLTLNKNSAVTTAYPSGSNQFTVTGNAAIKQTVSVGTSEETLSKGDIGTIGWVYLKNLDATNYVEFAGTTTDYVLKLKAGEFALVRWNKTNVLAKANTAACLVEYMLVED